MILFRKDFKIGEWPPEEKDENVKMCLLVVLLEKGV